MCLRCSSRTRRRSLLRKLSRSCQCKGIQSLRRGANTRRLLIRGPKRHPGLLRGCSLRAKRLQRQLRRKSAHRRRRGALRCQVCYRDSWLELNQKSAIWRFLIISFQRLGKLDRGLDRWWLRYRILHLPQYHTSCYCHTHFVIEDLFSNLELRSYQRHPIVIESLSLALLWSFNSIIL